MVFLFPVLQVFGIPNSPRSLDLDDRQGFIASSAKQQKKKKGQNGPIWSNPRGLEVFTSQHLSLSANFWTWWRTQEAPKANPAVAPHLLARKYLKGTHEWVNIPRVIVEELVEHSRGAVIQSVEHLPVVQGCPARLF